MNYEEALKNEYLIMNQKPVYCKLGERDFIVPYSYKGNVRSFLNDISSFQNQYIQDYTTYNRAHPNEKIEIPSLKKYGDADLLMPCSVAQKNISDEEKFKEAAKLFDKKTDEIYKNAIDKVMTVRSEYPTIPFQVSMNQRFLKQLDIYHHKYVYKKEKKLAPKVKKTLGFFGKNIVRGISGAFGLPFSMIYQTLDKKFKFPKNKFNTFMRQKFVPYTHTGTATALLSLMSITGVYNLQKSMAFDNLHSVKSITNPPKIKKPNIDVFIASRNLPQKKDTIPAKKEIKHEPAKVQKEEIRKSLPEVKFPKMSEVESPNTIIIGSKQKFEEEIFNNNVVRNIDINKKYKITDKSSFQNLYKETFPLILQSLITSEILVCHPYSDGADDINTIGLGNYYYPENGDYRSSKWILFSEYCKKHPEKAKNMVIDGDEAKKLALGWAIYREHGRIFGQIYDKLKNSEITPHQFAMIWDLTINGEVNGLDFCNYFRENSKNKIDCAKRILSYRSKNPKYRAGIDKRRMHDYFLFLNHKGYAENLISFRIVQGIGSNGQTSFGSSITSISNAECLAFRTAVMTGNKGVIDATCNKIMKFSPSNGKSVYRIIRENNMGISSVFNIRSPQFKKEKLLYDVQIRSMENAVAHYKEKNYKEAIQGFKNTLKLKYASPELYLALANSYYHEGEYSSCLTMCLRAKAYGEKKYASQIAHLRGKSYWFSGNKPKALSCLRSACRENPNDTIYANDYKSAQKNFNSKPNLPMTIFSNDKKRV